MTVVSQSNFASGKSIAGRTMAPPPQWHGATATPRPPGIQPERRSVLGPSGQTAVKRPSIAILNRPVVARHEPPAPPPSIDRQFDAIRANGGRALPPAQLQHLPGSESQRSHVVVAPPAARNAPFAAPSPPPAAPAAPGAPAIRVTPVTPATPSPRVSPGKTGYAGRARGTRYAGYARYTRAAAERPALHPRAIAAGSGAPASSSTGAGPAADASSAARAFARAGRGARRAATPARGAAPGRFASAAAGGYASVYCAAAAATVTAATDAAGSACAGARARASRRAAAYATAAAGGSAAQGQAGSPGRSGGGVARASRPEGAATTQNGGSSQPSSPSIRRCASRGPHEPRAYSYTGVLSPSMGSTTAHCASIDPGARTVPGRHAGRRPAAARTASAHRRAGA